MSLQRKLHRRASIREEFLKEAFPYNANMPEIIKEYISKTKRDDNNRTKKTIKT